MYQWLFSGTSDSHSDTPNTMAMKVLVDDLFQQPFPPPNKKLKTPQGFPAKSYDFKEKKQQIPSNSYTLPKTNSSHLKMDELEIQEFAHLQGPKNLFVLGRGKNSFPKNFLPKNLAPAWVKCNRRQFLPQQQPLKATNLSWLMGFSNGKFRNM